MSVITKDRKLLTLIITLEVKPENFEELLALVMEETESFVRHQAGFVSANLHRNADSTKLINYGQWQNQGLYEEARARPEFQAFSERVEALAQVTAIPVDVVFTEDHPPSGG